MTDHEAPTSAGTTAAGIPLRPFYRPDDSSSDQGTLADPGTYPFTRGRLRPPDARPHGWIQRELSGEGSPRRSNQQLRALLADGALGVDVIGDNPTVSALDPDHPGTVPAGRRGGRHRRRRGSPGGGGRRRPGHAGQRARAGLRHHRP